MGLACPGMRWPLIWLGQSRRLGFVPVPFQSALLNGLILDVFFLWMRSRAFGDIEEELNLHVFPLPGLIKPKSFHFAVGGGHLAG